MNSMNDMNDMNDMNGTRSEVTSLRLPIQAMPVYRTTVGGARTGAGVEASGWVEDIVRTAGGIAARW